MKHIRITGRPVKKQNMLPPFGAVVTFSDIAKQWLETRQGEVKASTLSNYATSVERHLLPELGPIPMDRLTEQRLNSFLSEKLRSGRLDGKGGLSRKTVTDLRAILKLILRFARDQGFRKAGGISLNALGARQPKVETFSRKEQEKLEDILFSRNDPLYFGVLLALYGGLRIGELCALQWGDLNFEDGTLRVSKTLLRIRNLDPAAAQKTKVIIDRPKSQSSDRVIPLPDFLLLYIIRYRLPDDHYLVTGTPHWLEPRICLEKYKRILSDAQVPDHTFHALRHTFATRCIEYGMDVKSLSEIMGHSTVTVTMQRYVHPSMDVKRAQINRLSALTTHQDFCREA